MSFSKVQTLARMFRKCLLYFCIKMCTVFEAIQPRTELGDRRVRSKFPEETLDFLCPCLQACSWVYSAFYEICASDSFSEVKTAGVLN
jgi:hypothetical protein